MDFMIPYGTGGMGLRIPDDMDVETLVSAATQTPGLSGKALVEAAMAEPIGSPPLAALASGKKRAVIICSDHTRPVPSRAIIPPMLGALRKGNPDIDITLLIATGCHRPSTRDELIAKFGEEIVERENIVIHDCAKSEMYNLGTLPSGAALSINRMAVETELLIAEGFIEPHFFAGYSGGRKSVLPGICARETVLGNHCAAFIASPYSRTGLLEGNPIHRDMLAAAQMANLAFIVNTVSASGGNVAAAFAGHYAKAHEVGCRYLDSLCRVTARRPGDIVITSNGGAPLDQNIYQAVKGMTAAEAVAAPGAMLIMVAECTDGTGGDEFFAMLRNCPSSAALLAQILKISMQNTRADQWEAQILARVLAKHSVILVCRRDIRPIAEQMKLRTAATLDEAFQLALAEKFPAARVTVIPDGVGIVVGNA